MRSCQKIFALKKDFWMLHFKDVSALENMYVLLNPKLFHTAPPATVKSYTKCQLRPDLMTQFSKSVALCTLNQLGMIKRD